MSFQLMKERIKCSGTSLRDEMIRDGQDLFKEELEHDVSYSPTMYIYDSNTKQDSRLANIRVYGRQYSSLNGNYMQFASTYDNPIKIGEYIHDKKDNTYWLVYNAFNVDDIQYEGKLIQCNYPLKWQLSDGTIVERWSNIVSASKYDVGENGNSTMVLTSNNFTILMGFCDEGFELEGKRVFIDKRNNNPTKIFKITRSDDVLFDSGDMGALLSFVADKTDIDKDKDRPDLKLCDYIDTSVVPIPPSNNEDTTIINATISGNNKLKITIPRTYTALLSDNQGNTIEWDDKLYGFSVVSDFDVVQNVSKNKISLCVEDEQCISSSFLLQLIKLDNQSVMIEVEITVVDIV